MGKYTNETTATDEVLGERPSVDKTARFAIDALLRKHGFSIYKRPLKGEPFWYMKGRVFSQEMALKSIDVNDVGDAKYAEELLHEGFE